jgi:hypothetical protein
MREKEFADWMTKPGKTNGTPYAGSTIKRYREYVSKVEGVLGNIDSERLSNKETYLERILTSFNELSKKTVENYHAGALTYFRFREMES